MLSINKTIIDENNVNLENKMKEIEHLFDNDSKKEFLCIEYIKSVNFTILHHLVLLTKEHPDVENIIEEYLIQYPTKINEQNAKGWSALHLAVSNVNIRSRFNTVKILVKRGANINVITNDGCTSLFFASRFAKIVGLNVGSFLIKNGADVNITNVYGYTPLHVSVLNVKKTSLLRMVRLLINNKSNINAQTNEGYNALHLTILNEEFMSMAVIKLLLSSGIDLNASCKQGNTALHYLAKQNAKKKQKVLDELLIAGADVNVQNNKKMSPLQMAVKHGDKVHNLTLIKRLIDTGADVDLVTEYKSSLLHLAVDNTKTNLKNIIKILANKVDLNKKNNYEQTPLHLAIKKTKYLPDDEIIKLLLKTKNIKINNPSTSYLYLAAACLPSNKLDNVIQMLLDNGATLKNNEPVNRQAMKCICKKYKSKTSIADCVVCLNLDQVTLCANNHGICAECCQYLNEQGKYNCALCNSFIIQQSIDKENAIEV
jgi:ankyrin repeat protein